MLISNTTCTWREGGISITHPEIIVKFGVTNSAVDKDKPSLSSAVWISAVRSALLRFSTDFW